MADDRSGFKRIGPDITAGNGNAASPESGVHRFKEEIIFDKARSFAGNAEFQPCNIRFMRCKLHFMRRKCSFNQTEDGLKSCKAGFKRAEERFQVMNFNTRPCKVHFQACKDRFIAINAQLKPCKERCIDCSGRTVEKTDRARPRDVQFMRHAARLSGSDHQLQSSAMQFFKKPIRCIPIGTAFVQMDPGLKPREAGLILHKVRLMSCKVEWMSCKAEFKPFKARFTSRKIRFVERNAIRTGTEKNQSKGCGAYIKVCQKLTRSSLTRYGSKTF